jgi:hypothetical protein
VTHVNTRWQSRFFQTSIFVWASSNPGLPDGIVSNQKSQFGQILAALAMDDGGILYVHLVYFTAIWYVYYMVI